MTDAQPPSAKILAITHDFAAGTILTGTDRGDGAAPILKRLGWRWSASILAGDGQYGAWYLRGSRDRLARADLLSDAAQALRDGGFTVEVQVDNSPRPMEEAEGDRARHMNARARVLHAKAEDRGEQAAATLGNAHDMAERIPFGQPILLGHHSESRDRRHRERIHTLQDKGMQLAAEAETIGDRAASAAGHMDHRYNPETVVNRIAGLASDRRRVDRELGSARHPAAGSS